MTKGKTEAEKAAGKTTWQQHQAKVVDLFFKGYTRARIVKTTGYEPKEVDHALKLLHKSLSGQAEKALEYRRKLVLSKIQLVQVTGWEIAEKAGVEDTAKVSALRLVKDAIKVEGDILGVTKDKSPASADKQADKLRKDMKDAEKKSRTDEETAEAGEGEETEEVITPLPDFLIRGRQR